MSTNDPVDPVEEQDFDYAGSLSDPAEQEGGEHGPPEGDAADGDERVLEAPAPAAPQPIPATCKRDFAAVHHSGTRQLSDISLVVIHSTESNSARSSAEWFANPNSNGSAHILVDDRECYRTLDNTVIPWGAPGANTRGFHIEHAGWAHWSTQDWLSHEQTLRRGAYKAALHAGRFHIPLRWLAVDDLRHGRAGFVTHATGACQR